MFKYKNSAPEIDNVKLIAGVLAASEKYLSRAVELLVSQYGAVDLKSEPVRFDYTTYYDREMGESILRQFVSFKKPLYPGFMARTKLETNAMEQAEAIDGCRRFNLDPGYLNEASLVLATTKPASFRVYLGHGIFAQPTLCYQKKSFRPYEWTYADYRDQRHIDFFNAVRSLYRERVKRI